MMWPLFQESSFMRNFRVPDPSYGMDTSCKYITKINGIKKDSISVGRQSREVDPNRRVEVQR